MGSPVMFCPLSARAMNLSTLFAEQFNDWKSEMKLSSTSFKVANGSASSRLQMKAHPPGTAKWKSGTSRPSISIEQTREEKKPTG